MNTLKIVLPMAGEGTRMRPLTWSKPKALIQIADRPLLGHVLASLDTLPPTLPRELVFITGYLGEQIGPYMAAHHPEEKVHYVEQRERLGQSHAVYQAREFLDGPMLLVWSDTLIETDLSFLGDESAGGVAWVREVPDPRRFGVAELGPDGWVRRLVEKPQSLDNRLVVVGFYYFADSRSLLRAIETQMERDISLGGEYYLIDALNIMLERGLRMRTEPVEVWLDAGKPETTLETNAWLLENGRANHLEGSDLDGVKIVPPVYMPPDCRVEGSILGPNVSIGAGVRVRGSHIRNSIVEGGARIEGADLHDSLVGRRSTITGAHGTIHIGDDGLIEADGPGEEAGK